MDRRDEAEETLHRSIQMAERIGYLRGTWSAYRLLAECARRNGQSPLADQYSAKVREIVERASATLSSPALRSRLLDFAER